MSKSTPAVGDTVRVTKASFVDHLPTEGTLVEIDPTFHIGTEPHPFRVSGDAPSFVSNGGDIWAVKVEVIEDAPAAPARPTVTIQIDVMPRDEGWTPEQAAEEAWADVQDWVHTGYRPVVTVVMEDETSHDVDLEEWSDPTPDHQWQVTEGPGYQPDTRDEHDPTL